MPPLLTALLVALAARAEDDDALVLAKTCTPVEQQRLAQAERAARHTADGPRATDVIHGLRLTDSVHRLGWLKRSLGNKPPQAWQRAVEAHCADAVCALEKTLGDRESALWFLAASAEVDAPPSLDQGPYDVESVWEPHELRALARALLEAPPELKRVPTLRAFRRLPSGSQIKKGAFYNAVSYQKDAELHGLGTIVIRDTVWKFPQRDARAALLHELGHHWDYSRSHESGKTWPSLQESWLKLSGWRAKSGGHNPQDYALAPGVQIATAGETLPTEDFADSVANYRFAPRLLKTYSKAKFEAMRMLWQREPKKLAGDDVDAAWAAIGGPLKSLRECASSIQRASFGGKLHQHELYIVTRTAKGTHWEPVARNQFVVRAGCIDRAMAALEKSPKWSDVTCTHDPEDVAVAVADRLEEAWASWAEAAQAIRAAVPRETAASCLEHKKLTQSCFAGDGGVQAAQAEADRIAAEFHGDAQGLAAQLVTQTPLAPPDDELRERFPVLQSAGDLLFACLKGALDIQQRPEKQYQWTYWVKLPPANEKRGFSDPVWNAGCERDFAAHLDQVGFSFDAADKLSDHLAYLLQLQAAPLLEKFNEQILRSASELRTACKPNARACAVAWLKPRLSGIAPDHLSTQLAEALVGKLHPASH